MAAENIDSSPLMFGAYVESVSSSIGWNGQGGSCQMTLVEDPSNNIYIDLPEVGTACYFRFKAFYYGGVFQRWTFKEDIGGRKYDIVLESPGGKVLNGVNAILSNFDGTFYNEGEEYDKIKPYDNPKFTRQLKNVWNPYAYRENFQYGGRFGAANTNSAGFPARDLLDLLEILSRGESQFGDKISYGESEYELDLGRLKDVPEFFRISGQSLNLNAIISECAELLQYDYFADVEPKSGKPSEDGGGVIADPVIKVVTTDKTQQPDPGVVRTIIEESKDSGVLVSSDVGQELSDEVTQRVVIGGPASRYFIATIGDCIPIWGKLGPKKYALAPNFASATVAYRDDASVPVILDETLELGAPESSNLLTGVFGTTYYASVLELRMAMAGMESWQTFKVFQSIAKGTYLTDPWVVGMEFDASILNELASGSRGPISLAATSIASGQKSYDPAVQDYVKRIFDKVSKTASEFYGRMFLVPLPKEPGGITNNVKFVQEDLIEVVSWESSESAWVSNKPVSDIAFYDGNGRLKSSAVYDIDSNFDYGDMKGDYAGWKTFGPSQPFSDGIATTQSGPDDGSIFYIQGIDQPFIVIDTGTQVKDFDENTTPDFGITFLAKYFFNINIPPTNYIRPGKPNTQISVPPKVVLPKYLGVPQQSQRYSWGPWFKSTADNGKSEVIFDTNLVPETFGSVSDLNQAGQDTASAGASELKANESGRIELAEFPEYSIAERFSGSGPYVTDMNISIGTGGVTTSYQFNTWTPNFGKLTKYNADRISRIYKATIAALQRVRADNPKRAFKPRKFEKTDFKELSARQSANRTSAGFSLFNLFGNPHVEGDQVNLSDAAGLSSFSLDTSFGCSEDQKWSPVATRSQKRGDDLGVYFANPDIPQEESGKFSAGVCPSSRDLDPYFSEAVFGDASKMIRNSDFVAVVNSSDGKSYDLQVRKANQVGTIDQVRSVGLRGPMIVSGWGFDIANNPTPSKKKDITEFDTDSVIRRENWKTGPVNLMWDEERKIWAGGLEVITGVLDSDITAPENPLSPTTFNINVLRRTANIKGAGAQEVTKETVKCYNRDPSLEQVKDNNVFVMAIRVNYEWTPLWVGCP